MTNTNSSPHSWSTPVKIGFRFIGIYLLLIALSMQSPGGFIFTPLWKVCSIALGNILEITLPEYDGPTGSGDGLLVYLQLLCMLIVSSIATVIWSVVDRNRPNYRRLLEWLIVVIRYYLALQMFIYGVAKLTGGQFGAPSFHRLIQPYGESSPMGLLWTFMGASTEYSVFTGIGELLGAVLLLFSRTRTLGALTVFAVMINVFMLNLSYDVPVKILSGHIVLMSIFLIVLDLPRLWDFFIRNKSTEPKTMIPLFPNADWVMAKNITKAVILIGGGAVATYFIYASSQVYNSSKTNIPLYGLYEVQDFQKNGEEVPPLITDAIRWKYLIVERTDRALIKGLNGVLKRYKTEIDTVSHTLELFNRNDSISFGKLNYYELDSSRLELQGIVHSDTLLIRMNRKMKEDFLLMNRKFRWVSESPYNR